MSFNRKVGTGEITIKIISDLIKPGNLNVLCVDICTLKPYLFRVSHLQVYLTSSPALLLLYLVEYVKFALFVNRPLFDVGSYGKRRNDKCGVSDYRVATLLPSPAT